MVQHSRGKGKKNMVISIDSEEYLINSQVLLEQNNIQIKYRSTRSHMTQPYLKV